MNEELEREGGEEGLKRGDFAVWWVGGGERGGRERTRIARCHKVDLRKAPTVVE